MILVDGEEVEADKTKSEKESEGHTRVKSEYID